MLLVTLVVMVAVLAGTGAASAQQGGSREVGEPELSARAWALTDLRSEEYLAGEHASKELAVASTTKIMAALVVLEKSDLDEEVTVSKNAAAYATPAYSNVGLLPGDTLSVRELLMAALISSGDDAAYALAEHVGGGGEAGVDRFVEEMNERAKAAGLENTRFENPVGFDARGHYSSARDLARMARLAMQHPEFREIVSTEYATIRTPYRKIPLASTNELLFTYGPATGIKTGTTPAAGESLVSSASTKDESYVCVVLDSKEERFAASVRALRYGFAAYGRKDLVVEGQRRQHQSALQTGAEHGSRGARECGRPRGREPRRGARCRVGKGSSSFGQGGNEARRGRRRGRWGEDREDPSCREEGLRGGLARAAGVVYRGGDFPIGDR